MVKPDNTIVHIQYNNRENMFDYMQFGAEGEHANWESLANKFVLERDNKNLNNFVARVIAAKL